MASMLDFRLVRLEAAGSLATYADLTTLSEHPWSHMVVDGRGNAYVGNIGLDFPAGAFAPAILALATPDGSVRRVADGIAFANGMVVTPDNSTLILAESYGIQLTAFDIEDHGSLSNRRTVGRTRGRSPGPDLPGCRGRHLVRRRPAQAMRPRPRGWRGARDGRARSRVLRLDVGRPDGRTLFLMAAEFTDAASMGSGARTGQVLAVPAPAPGARWP
jgi:SMP-30/Gluconolactonase/LRE-like region